MTEEEINKKAEKHCNEVLCNAHEKCNEVIKCRDWRSRRAGFFCGYEQALKDFEKENAELKNKLEHRNCLDCSNHSSKLRMKTLELEKECTKIIRNLLSPYTTYADSFDDRDNEIVEEAVQFLSEVENV